MPNTSALSQIIPNFSATKNGQTTSDVKTTTNFNQILKNEVANKVKKPPTAPTNTNKPPANSQTTPTTASQNKTTAGKESDSADKSISTEDTKSDEHDVAALAIPDETANLLSFVDNVNALAYANQNDMAKVDANSVEDGTSDETAVKSVAIGQAASSNTDLVNYANPPEIAKLASTQNEQTEQVDQINPLVQNIRVSNQQPEADTNSVKQSSLASNVKDNISTELVAGSTEQASITSTTPTPDKSRFNKTVEEIDTAATAIIKDENLTTINKTIQDEQLSGLAAS